MNSNSRGYRCKPAHGPGILDMKDQSLHCRLFDIPAELRVHIYELVYATGQDDGKQICLIRPHPPTKELLLVCKDIHREAQSIYKAAYAAYWTQGNFAFDNNRDTYAGIDDRAFMLAHREDIEHIRKLQIVTHHQIPYEIWYDLVHPTGGWWITDSDGDDRGGRRFRPWTTLGEIDPTRLAWDAYGDRASLDEACNLHSTTHIPLVNQIFHWLGHALDVPDAESFALSPESARWRRTEKTINTWDSATPHDDYDPATPPDGWISPCHSPTNQVSAASPPSSPSVYDPVSPRYEPTSPTQGPAPQSHRASDTEGPGESNFSPNSSREAESSAVLN